MRSITGNPDQCDTDGDECCHKNHDSEVDPKKIMFCIDSESILDSTYSRPLRDSLSRNRSGWVNNQNIDEVIEILSKCYWWKFVTLSDINYLIDSRGNRSLSFPFVKHAVEQVLHTINGLMAKKLIIFPAELEGYKALAKQTASLFGSLIRDYLSIQTTSVQPSFLKGMKTYFQRIKNSFSHPDHEVRGSVLDLPIEPYMKSFSVFWRTCLKRLNRRINAGNLSTYSPMWFHIFGSLSQTRNLGHLPERLAIEKRQEYRMIISTPEIQIPDEKLIYIMQLVKAKCHSAGIPQNILRGRSNPEEVGRAISAIDLKIEVKGSNLQTVNSGGRFEDARRLLSEARRHGWEIPVRDFETGEIQRYIDWNIKEDETAPQGYIFWTSLQIVINFIASNQKFKGRLSSFKRELKESAIWEETIDSVIITHISEPGKERNLTKPSSLLVWALTPGSKVCQEILSLDQDHRAGLAMAAQDWNHLERIGVESDEGKHLYVKGKMNPLVWHTYQDWTSSTDYARRRAGHAALGSFMHYIGFPNWYGKVLQCCINIDSRYSEKLSPMERDRSGLCTQAGRITEGFPMSLPMTKTILHLMHSIHLQFASEIFQSQGRNVMILK